MKQLPSAKKDAWTGYTFDRLAYERAVTLARLEIEKHRLATDIERTRQGNLLFSRSTFSRLISIVSFTDFIVIGVKLWRTLSPIFSRKR
ncbi:MAG: hypothetical protein Q4C34_09895 [Bacteroidales bacterium]|nr:hypothetical protein [Bacteroidales bacterium]